MISNKTTKPMKNNNNQNIIPSVNNDPFFQNNSEFTNEYIIKCTNRVTEPTWYEKKILNEYFLTDIGFGFDKDINFNSSLVSSYLDFARWYLNKN